MPKKLGEILIEDGKLTEAQLQKALKAQLIFGGHLGTSLIELGYIDEETLGETLAKSFDVPYARYDILENVPYSVVRSMPAKLVEKYKVVPIRLDGKVLQLAMMDPKNLMALDEISFVTGYKIDPWVAPEIRIYQVVERYYNIPRSQRYVALARELGKLRTRGQKITPGGAGERSKEPTWDLPEETDISGPIEEQEEEGTTAPVPVLRTEPPGAGETPPGRPALDHWEKYGYGKSWREYADAMEDVHPSAGAATLPDKPDLRRQLGAALSPEMELAEASRRLAECGSPDEIAEIVLTFAARFLKRSALFVMRGDQMIGWGGSGEGFSAARIKGMCLPMVRDSLFSLVDDGRRHFIGSVPAFPSIRSFYQDLSVQMPKTAMVVPIRIKDKLASVLYGDGGSEEDLRSIDAGCFERLASKASLAMQMLIFRHKILSS